MTAVDSALVALATLLLTFAMVALVRWLGRTRSWLDVPVSRSAHEAPTPTMGGLGIIAAIAIVWTVGRLVGPAPFSPSVSLACAALLVAGISLCDDVWNLPALPRLTVHVTAAVLIVAGTGGPSWLFVAISVFWIAGFINAFNFMDGIDGIAGLHALIAGLAWVVIGLSQTEPALVWTGLLISSACAGFLLLNWSPSSVFMGDVGATFLGVALASVPWVTSDPARWLAPAVLVTWPFWFDAGVTLADRIRRREVLGAGHQRHFYQRLIRAGWSHPRVALLYGVMTLAGAGAATLAAGESMPAGVAIIAVSAAGLVTVVRAVEKLPPSAVAITASESGPQSTR